MSARKVAPAQPASPALLTIPLAHIEPDPVQLRRHFDPAALAELAESIKASGLLQPITVKVWGGLDRYRIISGERRYRASQMAGLKSIACIVRNDLTGNEVEVLQLLENLQRADLTPAELIKGVEGLATSYSAAEIGKKLGKDKAWVSRHSTVSKLWEPARALAMENLCSVELAHDLATLQDCNAPRAQQLAEMIRKPPQHRGAVTREEVRSHIDMAKRMATEQAQAKDRKAAREIAADNRRGYSSAAGDGDMPPSNPRDTQPLDREEDTAHDKGANTPDLGEHPQAQLTLSAPKASHPLQAWADTSAKQIEDLLARTLGLTADAAGWWEKADGTPVVFEVHPVLVNDEGEPITEQHLVRYDLQLRELLRVDLEKLAGGTQSQSDRVELLLRPDEQTIQRFIADFTVPRDGDRTKCDWLHAEYGKWCAQTALQAQSEAEFSRVMGLLGFTKHRFASGRHYMNIGPKQVDA